jgi:hypothetical protein
VLAKFNETKLFNNQQTMSAPRAPRKSTGGVDVQLEEFEEDLRGLLELQLGHAADRHFWYENAQLSDEDNLLTVQAIDGAFLDLMHRYGNVHQVHDILEHCRILIQNVVWASMNVPLAASIQHAWADDHIEAVINNALQVYNRVIYAHLRTEMIMANHNAQVLQRTWRRCITDPDHPACRRRLMDEFDQATNLLPKNF